ncbi:alpha/beta fold hydrolase [Cellulosimicrobium cellulans]|uniref:alpha/beta fold hydrolase n=1 Tax=Cellulosimicrobium cellulans TaxID=1710 RepID=UPI002404DFF3|nr:alpha/beta hydrolase [Cellulosimicrobium cellulans]MDF9874728.1 pimeloyl-ACP methyl ester carboxylesterase [Cellulosimicrobium cellulans]
MSTTQPLVLLVHGAFAGSDSWDGVVERLLARSVDVVALANPLRSVTGDAAYVRDVVTAVDRPVVLVGHSYGGIVVTSAAADNDAVKALVYVGAFAPDAGESALQLSGKFPGSTLGETLIGYPLTSGGNELRIRGDAFPSQFAADVPVERAVVMGAEQRPVTELALSEGLPGADAAWRHVPSWFVYGEEDRNIPAELQRFMAERAGSRGTTAVAGGSHALSVSRPAEVAATIMDAVAAVS